VAAIINTISIREFMSAIFLANKIREQDPKAKICFLSATQRSMKILEKHEWYWVKQSMKTTLFKCQSIWKTYLKN
jgi:3-deoxy-D-manno-octulosonic-acid transferase